jgi:very-short-patch-repair endonuclease
VADFACLQAKLIVEIDGSQHDVEIDRRRTAELEAQRFAIIRFWNSDVFENLDGVLETIHATAQQRVEEVRRRPSPNPLPQAGEG